MMRLTALDDLLDFDCSVVATAESKRKTVEKYFVFRVRKSGYVMQRAMTNTYQQKGIYCFSSSLKQ